MNGPTISFEACLDQAIADLGGTAVETPPAFLPVSSDDVACAPRTTAAWGRSA